MVQRGCCRKADNLEQFPAFRRKHIENGSQRSRKLRLETNFRYYKCVSLSTPDSLSSFPGQDDGMKKCLAIFFCIASPSASGGQPALLENVAAHIDTLESYESRHVRHAGNRKAAGYIAAQLVRYGYSPQKDHFECSDTPTYNIFSGSADRTKPFFLLSAHFDSIAYENGRVLDSAPGADDNASGVAAALELARLLKNSKRNIEFVFFNCEELAAQGSQHTAEWMKNNGLEIDYVINLDTIGTWDGPISSVNPVNYQANEASMVLIEQMQRKDIFPLRKAEELWLDDHGNFWAYGYRAIELSENGIPQAMHKATDTAEKLNLQNILLIIDGLADFLGGP